MEGKTEGTFFTHGGSVEGKGTGAKEGSEANLLREMDGGSRGILRKKIGGDFGVLEKKTCLSRRRK